MAIHRMGMIALVVMLASVACAQSAKAAIIKDLEAQVASTKQYCEMVSRYAADHKPIEVAARSENGSQRWYRLPNTPETFPQPILSAPNAKVWVFEGQIVAVSLITEDVSRGFNRLNTASGRTESWRVWSSSRKRGKSSFSRHTGAGGM